MKQLLIVAFLALNLASQLQAAITSAIILEPTPETNTALPKVLILNDMHWERYSLRGNEHFRSLITKQIDSLVDELKDSNIPLATEGLTATNIVCQDLKEQIKSFYSENIPARAKNSAMDYFAQKYYSHALSIDLRQVLTIIYYLIAAKPNHYLVAAYRSKLTFSIVINCLTQQLTLMNKNGLADELNELIEHIKKFCSQYTICLEKSIEHATRHLTQEQLAPFLSILENNATKKVAPHFFEFFAVHSISTTTTPIIIIHCGLAHGASIQQILENNYHYQTHGRLDGKIAILSLEDAARENDLFCNEMTHSDKTSDQIAKDCFNRYCLQPEGLSQFVKKYL